MKWWTAIAAITTLTLAGVSIMLGSRLNELIIDAQYLWFASLIGAIVAAILGALDAQFSKRRIWAVTLHCLVSIDAVFGLIGGLDVLPKGPFCSTYSAGGGICIQSTPLAVDAYLFAPVFILAIPALTYAFWPHRPNHMSAAIQAGWRR